MSPVYPSQSAESIQVSKSQTCHFPGSRNGSAFEFRCPSDGRRFDLGRVRNPGDASAPFQGHKEPLLFQDRFDNADASAWKDYGTPTRRESGRLIGGKGMITVMEQVRGAD